MERGDVKTYMPGCAGERREVSRSERGPEKIGGGFPDQDDLLSKRAEEFPDPGGIPRKWDFPDRGVTLRKWGKDLPVRENETAKKGGRLPAQEEILILLTPVRTRI
jgi:hypothetical protein